MCTFGYCITISSRAPKDVYSKTHTHLQNETTLIDKRCPMSSQCNATVRQLTAYYYLVTTNIDCLCPLVLNHGGSLIAFDTTRPRSVVNIYHDDCATFMTFNFLSNASFRDNTFDKIRATKKRRFIPSLRNLDYTGQQSDNPSRP